METSLTILLLTLTFLNSCMLIKFAVDIYKVHVVLAILECEAIKNRIVTKDILEYSQEGIKKIKKIEDIRNTEISEKAKKWENLKDAFRNPVSSYKINE